MKLFRTTVYSVKKEREREQEKKSIIQNERKGGETKAPRKHALGKHGQLMNFFGTHDVYAGKDGRKLRTKVVTRVESNPSRE